MGLNSLNDYYLMKIYIKKFKLPSISNDIEYKKIVNNKTFLLTHYGKIEVTPNSLKTFILENSHVSEVENFIKDYNCFFSQENWKYSGKTQIVPTEHEPICIVYESYEITEKLHFVLEKKDEEIIDFYFDTSYSLDNYHLKEELNSFFTKINNMA